MTKWMFATAMTLVLIYFCQAMAIPGAGRTRQDMGGWGRDGEFSQMFSRQNIVFLTGTIEEIKPVAPIKGMTEGVAVVLKAQEDTIELLLGPKWFINNQRISFSRNDMIEVRGVKVTLHKKTFFIPARIIKGDYILELRNEDGVPVWDAARRR